MQKRYPNRGFKFHEGLTFRSDQGSVGIYAKTRINEGEVLIVVPESAKITTKYLVQRTQRLQAIENATRQYYRSKNPNGGERHLDEDAVVLQVLLTIATSAHCKEEHWLPFFDTWPQSDPQSAFEWTDAEVDNLIGTTAHARFVSLRQEVEENFISIALPILASSHVLFSASAIPEAKWRALYMRVVMITWSRTHDGREGEGPILTPLVDCVNGMPENCPAINCEFYRGFWPFLRGAMFRNDCNLACGALSATHPIAAGGQLIVSYGDLGTSSFAAKYGVVPDRTLEEEYCGFSDKVCILPPPQLLPQEDSLLWKALVSQGYTREGLVMHPVVGTLDSSFVLLASEVEEYR
jgi:hypothetical protein